MDSEKQTFTELVQYQSEKIILKRFAERRHGASELSSHLLKVLQKSSMNLVLFRYFGDGFLVDKLLKGQSSVEAKEKRCYSYQRIFLLFLTAYESAASSSRFLVFPALL